MLNRSASLAMSTSVLKALPGKLDIKRHSPSILFLRVFLSAFLRLFPIMPWVGLWLCHIPWHANSSFFMIPI